MKCVNTTQFLNLKYIPSNIKNLKYKKVNFLRLTRICIHIPYLKINLREILNKMNFDEIYLDNDLFIINCKIYSCLVMISDYIEL